MTEFNSLWIPVEEVVKATMIDNGQNDNTAYQFFLSWACRGYKQLSWDIIKNYKSKWLTVNSDKTCDLPSDYVQYSEIGFIDDARKFIPFGVDNNLMLPTPKPITEDCHCHCGCTDQACQNLTTDNISIEQINIPTTIEQYSYTIDLSSFTIPDVMTSYVKNGTTVVINLNITTQAIMDNLFAGLGWTKISNGHYKISNTTDTWTKFNEGGEEHYTTLVEINYVQTPNYYPQTTKICQKGNSIVMEVCSPQATPTGAGDLADYIITPHIGIYPNTVTSYTKNGTVTAVGVVCNNQTQLNTYFASIGFINIADNTYQKQSTTDVWNSILIHGLTTNFTQSNVHTPFTVETICETTNQCNVTIKECGCITPSPDLTNWLNAIGINNWQNWGWWNSYYNPALSFPFPLNKGYNAFGYYNVYPFQGKIVISDDVILSEVLLRYYSNGDLDDNALQVPALCFEALVAYCTMKYKESSISTSHMNISEKQMAKNNFSTEFRKANARLNPIRKAELLQALRTSPRP